MPTYTYKARNEIGEAIAGTMDAVSEVELIQKLKKLSCIPVRVEEGRSEVASEEEKSFFFFKKGIKPDDMIAFTMQLSSMIDAGIPLLGALKVVCNQIANERLQEAISDITKTVTAGASFSEALSKHKNIFPPLYISMVRAGEATGKLDVVLSRFNIYFEKQEDLKRKVKEAMFYPIILMVTGVAVVLMIVTFVIPKFIDVFARANIDLPLPTQILFSLGIGLKSYWHVMLLVMGGCVFGFKRYVSRPEGQLKYDQFKLRIPGVGDLIRKHTVARFCRTLATLIESGVSILYALDILKDVVGNRVFYHLIIQARKSVERGERLDQPLKMSQEFPEDAVHMISAGEESGKLAYMLNKVADFYEKGVEHSVKKLTTLIEPLFIIIMGILVGFIMASMLIPMFDMVKTIQG